MPFVSRRVEPRYVSRTSLRDAGGRPRVKDEELQAVTNCTLAGAVKQLACLVLLADDVFSELTSRLSEVTLRSQTLRSRIARLGEGVEKYDPKTVTVPEDSLSNFAQRKVHYKASRPLYKELFVPNTRPQCVRVLYSRATSGRLPAALLDQLRQDVAHLSLVQCTPVLTKRRQRIDREIEAHIPAAVEELRKWTSQEAVGDVTALPDASSRIASGVTLTPEELSDVGSGDDEPLDHQLPSPEEQLRVIISKFAPEVIAINTTGKFFDRMCTSRKSLHAEVAAVGDGAVKRRARSRRPRGKRRNTISGTDHRELREAVAGDTSSAVAEDPQPSVAVRSHSSDLLEKSPLAKKPSHFDTLKQWGKSRLRLVSRSPTTGDSLRDRGDTESPSLRESERDEPGHKRCGSYSSDDKSATGVPAAPTATISHGVKLRSYSAQRRLRRSGVGKEEPHSSSGNWSASSESGRASVASESTTVPPRSTTSAATSVNSLHTHGPPSSVVSRRRVFNTSGSSSVTSEGGDDAHEHDDIETSSEYSCDTEGYYTSFHLDSGLKTLKEEDAPSTPLHTSNALSSSSVSQNVTAENEYELFGKGSTSTTTSSAGTVCTTLMAAGSDRSLVIGPTVPERKSSLTKLNRSRGSVHSANATLERSYSNSSDRFSSLRFKPRDGADKQRFNISLPIKEFNESMITITNDVGKARETVLAMVHNEPEGDSAKKSTGTSSPDSGHNTSSSPIEDSVSSAPGKHSLSEQDYSESSDLEGCDRIERIRCKTTINSSRIPSLCVITPSNSDDEGESERKETEVKPPLVVEMLKKVSPRPKLEIPSDVVFESKPKDTRKDVCETPQNAHSKPSNLKNPLMPLNNLMCRLKGVLPQKLKKSPSSKEAELPESLYDSGEYVTIADVRNNNQKANVNYRGTYEKNDVVKKNLQTVLSGKLRETEYVSLNELPNCLNENKDFLETTEPKHLMNYTDYTQIGAKVTLDSRGKVIYSSDSIRRRKGAHTTFEPGPFVKELQCEPAFGQTNSSSTDSDELDSAIKKKPTPPTSPQLGKVIIRAPSEPDGPVMKELIALPMPKPSTIITASIGDRPVNPVKPELHHPRLPHTTTTATKAVTPRGAYVNLQDTEGVSLSPAKDNTDHPSSAADPPPPRTRLDLVQSTRPHNVGTPPAQTFHRDNSVYWTLRPQRTSQQPPDRYRSLNRPRHIPSSSMYQNVQQLREESLNVSPIATRGSAPFRSSTPSKSVVDLSARTLSPAKSTMSNEELYAVIHKTKKNLNIQRDRCESPALSSISLSPVSSESSLPRQRPIESGYLADARSRGNAEATTCADRLGPLPQTSRLDFKRLLLQHGVRLNAIDPQHAKKVSAVEQLRLDRAKETLSNASHINILDLSGSPKTYANRKIIRAAPSGSSPSRTSEHKTTPKIMSPKSHWRFASPRSDVLSSPIAEGDEANSSGEKTSPGDTVRIATDQHFGARRNLIPANEATVGSGYDSGHLRSVKPLDPRPTMSRAEVLQAKRAEFFNSPPQNSPPRLTTFGAPRSRGDESPSPTASKAPSFPGHKTPSPNANKTQSFSGYKSASPTASKAPGFSGRKTPSPTGRKSWSPKRTPSPPALETAL